MSFIVGLILQSISPGLCDQDIITSCTDNELVGLMPKMKPDDVANSVIYCITLPDSINVHELVLKPIGEFV